MNLQRTNFLVLQTVVRLLGRGLKHRLKNLQDKCCIVSLLIFVCSLYKYFSVTTPTTIQCYAQLKYMLFALPTRISIFILCILRCPIKINYLKSIKVELQQVCA